MPKAKTTKRKTTRRKATRKTARKTAKAIEPTPLQLTPEQLFRWRMLEAEAKAAHAEMDKATLELQILLSQPPIPQAQQTVKDAQTTYTEKVQELREYMSGLGEELGLDMAKVAIDDKTGLIEKLP